MPKAPWPRRSDRGQTRGRGPRDGLAINVTDGESVQEALHQSSAMFGGFDLLVSNAGVLKAESVKTQPEKDFDFVTSVNYKGYFVCVQKAAADPCDSASGQERLLERHHPDQFQIGPARFEPQRRVRRQQIRRHRPDAVVRTGTGGGRNQG
jgi:NAD(P)-dependent dehydrogenase (short-subunit alcohol dehydrogenase family)